MPETPSPRLPEPDRPWMMRTYAGHSDARRSNELYRKNLEKGQTGLSIAFDLPTQTGYDPDHELAKGEVGKVGVSIAHRGDMATLLDQIPLDQMNTSMTINATAAWLLGAVRRRRRRARSAAGEASGDDPERHPQGVPEPGYLRLPAGAEHAADRGHDRLHGAAHPEVEPDQHLLLPPPGGGRDPSTGDRVHDEQRDRGPGRGPQPRAERAHGQRIRPHFVLRQRRRAVRRGARQAAGDGRALGRARARALRRRGREAPPAALRRPGQLARADRGPAGEQRLPDRARGARRDPRSRRARAGDPAARLERGARPPPALGPAMVPEAPADPRLRDRPARVPRPVRGLQGDGRARVASCSRAPARRCTEWPSWAARSRRSTT